VNAKYRKTFSPFLRVPCDPLLDTLDVTDRTGRRFMRAVSEGQEICVPVSSLIEALAYPRLFHRQERRYLLRGDFSKA
jgi:hypothetical protein